MNTEKNFFKTIAGKKEDIIDFFQEVSSNGDFKKIRGLNVLINSIRNLLITPQGTYPFDPNYGSNLHKMVFEPATESTILRIRSEIIEKIRQYDDRIQIENVRTSFFSDKKGYRVSIDLKYDKKEYEANMSFTDDDAQFVLEEG